MGSAGRPSSLQPLIRFRARVLLRRCQVTLLRYRLGKRATVRLILKSSTEATWRRLRRRRQGGGRGRRGRSPGRDRGAARRPPAAGTHPRSPARDLGGRGAVDLRPTARLPRDAAAEMARPSPRRWGLRQQRLPIEARRSARACVRWRRRAPLPKPGGAAHPPSTPSGEISCWAWPNVSSRPSVRSP